MSGNVWEWVWDWYGPYPAIPETDPVGAEASFSRVLRGGSWMASPSSARSANRYWCETRERAYPECREGPVGFRLARSCFRPAQWLARMALAGSRLHPFRAICLRGCVR